MRPFFPYHKFLIFLSFLLAVGVFSSRAQQKNNLRVTHLTGKPVFSQPAGFYSSAFELGMQTAQTGEYAYTVSAPGYESLSGTVTIIDEDLEILINLNEGKSVDLKENESGSRELFSVTFRVNTTGSNVVPGDDVYMSGTMADPMWPEPGTNPDLLMDEEAVGSAYYVLSFELEPGQYEYKYFRNAGWADGEWSGDPNRVVNIVGDTLINDLYGDINPPEPETPLFTVTFFVQDAGGLPLEDATITFDGITYEAGVYVIEDLMPRATIRYTTDGSIPTEDSPLFEENLQIDSRAGDPNIISLIPTNNVGGGSEQWFPPAGEIFKIHTVRARAFAPRMDPGETTTATYIVDPEGPARFSMPLVSIAAHYGAFFDPDTGIYVYGNYSNYFQEGDEWERLSHVEFFEEDGNLAFAQNLGVRTHGGTTRQRPRKSLRFYARSEYGESWVDYQFFPDKPVFEFKRFLLRNSGNDWDQAIFRDAFMQSLLKGVTKLDLQYSRPVVVFLNGEYWGVHNVRDRFDSRFIESHYGLGEMDYAMLENNAILDNGNPDGVAHYQEMIQFLQNNSMSNASNYASLQTRMDVESFIDHQVAEIYFMNTDWPGNNLQYWRKMTPSYQPDAPYGHDGRWRWMIKDTDFGFWLNFDYVPGVYEGPAHNTLAFALAPNGPGWPNPAWSTLIFRRLTENQQFRFALINRFCDMMNTVFQEDYVLNKLEEHRQLYFPEMEEHIHRWRTPYNVDHWNAQINRMASFGEQRPGYLKQHLKAQFGLGEMANVTVSSSNLLQGGVRVNRLEPDQITNPWTGSYFKNVPIEVEAVAQPGFRFSHWDGLPSETPALTTINLTQDTSIVAWFSNSLIHYWHFNNLPDETFTSVSSDFSLNDGALITYPGMGDGYMDRTDGTLLNANMNAPAGFGLRVRNPSNTRELIIAAPSTGYRELQFSFAVHRTNNGAQEEEFYYSTDGGESWNQVGTAYDIFLDYTVKHFDLSNIEEVNDNPQLQFRILFTGEAAAGIEGNNRFDNIALTGVAAALTLDITNPPAAVLNEYYPGHTFNVSGGVPPFSFSVTEGSLPEGMSLAGNGVLAGMPSESGNFQFTVMVTDQEGSSDSHSYLMVVEDKALIHYWHFNNLPDEVFTQVTADVSLVGNGLITYPGTGDGYMDQTDGSLLNGRLNQPAGYGLRVRNPSNTRELILAAPSTGYRDLVLTFAVHRTNNGAQEEQLYYSADGGSNWIALGDAYNIQLNYEIKTFDLSGIAAVNNNPTLRFRILFTDEAAAGIEGNNRFDNITLEGHSLSVGIDETGQLPIAPRNYPNPFREQTVIPLEIKEAGQVIVRVYDSNGRVITTLLDQHMEPGRHDLRFNAFGLPEGVYIYRIITGKYAISQIMLKMQDR
ncbi:MAG: CotH kinase family protein [Bacteroides sp.]|jgi:hypothetical protein|nr:CotH kinase family protein [Bacteroides sp.]